MPQVIVIEATNLVIEFLNKEFAELKQPISTLQIKQLLTAAINLGFTKVKDDQSARKELYRNLARKFHPDKILQDKSVWVNKFSASGLESQKQLPFQLLDTYYKSPDLLTAAITNPLDIAESFDRGWLEFFKRFLSEYQRYVLPISWTIFVIGVLLISILSLAYVGLIAVIGGLSYAINFLFVVEKAVLNTLTRSEYDIVVSERTSRKAMADFSRKELKANGNEDAEHVTDEDAISLYKAFLQINSIQQTSFEEQELVIKQKIIDEIYGIAHIQMTWTVFMRAINKPLPGGLLGNFLSIILRVIQAITLIPIMLVDMAIQGLKRIPEIVLIGGSAALALVLFIPILIVNTPLYIYTAIVNSTLFKPTSPTTSSVPNPVSKSSKSPTLEITPAKNDLHYGLKVGNGGLRFYDHKVNKVEPQQNDDHTLEANGNISP